MGVTAVTCQSYSCKLELAMEEICHSFTVVWVYESTHKNRI